MAILQLTMDMHNKAYGSSWQMTLVLDMKRFQFHSLFGEEKP